MKTIVCGCSETAKASGIFLLELLLEKSIKVEPGQFIVLESLNPFSVMPRPFSVYSANGNQISIMLKVVGPNTEAYVKLKPGDEIEISGPKGNPIPLDPEIESYILVAGSIGAAPLIFLAKELRLGGKTVTFLLGAKGQSQIFGVEELKTTGCYLRVITEETEENATKTGMVTDLLEEALAGNLGKSTIIACGPVVMLKKIAEMAAGSGNKCLVLLEEIMACGGSGNCKSCAVFGIDGAVKHVCSDGPAFDASWIDWGKMRHHYSVHFCNKNAVKDSPVSNPLAITLVGQDGRQLALESPAMISSGCFDATSKENKTDLSRAGAAVTKGISLEPRAGNSNPRVCEVPGGMLNSIGLENVGVVKFINEALPYWVGFGLPIIANIAGSTVEEYVEVVRRLAETGSIRAFEINISCPNVRRGGIAFGTEPDLTFRVVKAVRETAPDIFIIVKLTDAAGIFITDVAKAAVEAGADTISLINTVMGLSIDIETGKARLGNGAGGYSGPAILPISIERINRIHKAKIGVPIIGIGGIHDGASAVQAFLAGASAIQIGTASFSNSEVMTQICEFLEGYLHRKGFSRISEIIGKMEINS